MTTENTQTTAETQAEVKPASTEDVKSPVKADTTEEAATSEHGEENTDEAPKKKPEGGFQRKINKLTARIDAKEAEIAELRTQLNGKGSAGGTSADSEPEPTRPKESDFKDWDKFEEAKEKYVSDLAAWKIEQKIRKAQTEHVTRAEAQKAQETHKEAQRRIEKQAATLAPKFEGIEEAVEQFYTDRDFPVSRAMAEYIQETTDREAELIFQLVADPDEAERISKLSPLAAARALAKLEEKLPKPEARKVSGAPAPTKTVKGTAESPVKKLEDMSTAEYMAKRRADEAKAGTLRRMVALRN